MAIKIGVTLAFLLLFGWGAHEWTDGDGSGGGNSGYEGGCSAPGF